MVARNNKSEITGKKLTKILYSTKIKECGQNIFSD